MTIYEANRREIKLSIQALEKALRAVKDARVRLRRAMRVAQAEDNASFGEIANVFIDAGRPVTRQRIEQLLKQDLGEEG